jgi:hypothetical protein
VLAALDFLDMELPGQYQQMEYNPDSVIYVERLAADVVSLRRHCISMRRIEFVCSDGRSRFFSVHTGQASGSMGNTDQRAMMAFRCAAAFALSQTSLHSRIAHPRARVSCAPCTDMRANHCGWH